MIETAIPSKVKLSSKNQIVVPRAIRRKLGIKPKDELLIVYYRDRVYLMPKPKDWREYMRGLGKEIWRSAGGTDAYLKKERASWDF